MTYFSPSLEDLGALLDEELGGFLSEQERLLPEAVDLISEIRRMLGAGGKRLRPAFCYWGYRAAGAEHDERIVRAAMSLELLHTFAVVHDDIMDRSDERRGVPTTYASLGTDVALLVGDLALVLADAALMGSGFDAPVLLRGFECYSRMRQEVIAGQFLDVAAGNADAISVGQARRIAVLKSGRYSIEEPLVIGAELAGSPSTARALVRFGAPLGEAFQLRDDLLGSFGDRASVGKPVDSDIREGKRNVLFAFAAEHLEGEERAEFLSRWGGGEGLSGAEIERLLTLLETSGARRRTEALLDELTKQARDELERTETDQASRSALEELCRRATERET